MTRGKSAAAWGHGGPHVEPPARCGPCGDTTGPFIVDLGGETLCPACADDAALPCELCGRTPVAHIFTVDGRDLMETTAPPFGVPEFFAVCAACNGDQP